jgi:hypothetical protein
MRPIDIDKERLGVRLLLVGELWFLFSLIWSPPLFQFIAIINFAWVRRSVWLWFVDFILAAVLMISGLVFVKVSRKS